MNITKITYEKVFPIAQYCNERIGTEITITEGEDPQLAITTAKQMVEEAHKKNNPQLYIEVEQSLSEKYRQMEDKHVPDIPVTVGEKKTLQEEIQSCTSIKTLETYQFFIDKVVKDKKLQEELQKIYDNQYLILTT